jgi:phage baseplate assembly protein gpV
VQAPGGFSNEYRSEHTATSEMGQSEVTRFRDDCAITYEYRAHLVHELNARS